MAKRQIVTVLDEGRREYTDKQKEMHKKAIETREPYGIDGVFYRVEKVEYEKMMCYLTLETLEGDELHEAEKVYGIKHRNILGYLRQENEDFRWIEKIVPIMPGEDFSSMLQEDEFLKYYDIDMIHYPEELGKEITYDEEEECFNFEGYNYLVFVREGDKGQYRHWVQAYRFLENLNLEYEKKKRED